MNKIEAELRRNDIKFLFKSGIESSLPVNLFNKFITYQNNSLIINSINNKPALYNLDTYKNIYVTGAGKASASMAKALEDILLSKINNGIIVTKYGFSKPLNYVKVIEASHPYPDKNSVIAAEEILKMINGADKGDLIINFISGGASSLLALPVDEISLDDKINTTNVLLMKEASIHEINTIRKCISKVKGGGLISNSKAAVITLIISDVIGDNLDTIGSGPTYPSVPNYSKALEIIKKYNLFKLLPNAVINYLENACKKSTSVYNTYYPRFENYLIGNNDIVINTIESLAKSKGYSTYIIREKISGEVRSVSEQYYKFISSINDLPKPVCIISGGEVTVNVKGKGIGGRNQEFCLSLIKYINKSENIVILSCGTDGNDGPTNAAGALIDNELIKEAELLHLDYEKFLSINDSNNYFKKINSLIFTGPTLTNVMDIQIAIKY